MGIICVCEFTSEACHFVYKKKKKTNGHPTHKWNQNMAKPTLLTNTHCNLLD